MLEVFQRVLNLLGSNETIFTAVPRDGGTSRRAGETSIQVTGPRRKNRPWFRVNRSWARISPGLSNLSLPMG